jgi:hypothetical protein
LLPLIYQPAAAAGISIKSKPKPKRKQPNKATSTTTYASKATSSCRGKGTKQNGDEKIA